MTVRHVLLVILPAIVVFAPLTLSARRLTSERSTLRSAQRQLNTTAATAQRVIDLRGKRQQIADRKRPEQDVIARVTNSMARAGIPSDRFAGLRPESDSQLRVESEQGTYRRQTVRFSLSKLTVEELGTFLGDWCTSHPLWTPTQIELLHVRDKAHADRYNVNILLATTYLAEK